MPTGPVRQRLRVHAANTSDGPSVAIVGVTGAVGQEFLRVRSVSMEYLFLVIFTMPFTRHSRGFWASITLHVPILAYIHVSL